MAYVKELIKNLIIVILFTSFIELLLPEGNLRRYVRIVMGFFIIIILISPLAYVLKNDYENIYHIIPDGSVDINWKKIKKKGQEIEEENRTILGDYYEKKINKRLKEIVELEFPDMKNIVKVNINNSYEIETVYIKLLNKEIKEVNIETIEISNSPESDS